MLRVFNDLFKKIVKISLFEDNTIIKRKKNAWLKIINRSVHTSYYIGFCMFRAENSILGSEHTQYIALNLVSFDHGHIFLSIVVINTLY